MINSYQVFMPTETLNYDLARVNALAKELGMSLTRDLEKAESGSGENIAIEDIVSEVRRLSPLGMHYIRTLLKKRGSVFHFKPIKEIKLP